MASIVAESCEQFRTETGGILLGHYIEGAWFVIDVVDPGLTVTRRVTEFAYDEQYVNHLFRKIARLYKYPLKIIGIWHRHPGSMDTFSSVDDNSHRHLIDFVGNGLISLLVNFDPKFRITGYYVDKNAVYHKPPLKIGDEIVIPDLKAMATPEEIHRQYRIDYETGAIMEVSQGLPETESGKDDVDDSDSVTIKYFTKGKKLPQFICEKKVKKDSILMPLEGYMDGFEYYDMVKGELIEPSVPIVAPMCIYILKRSLF